MKINLSIIIPVYNAKKTIENAINSINKQKLKIKDLKVEIILIIDDGKKYEDCIPKLKIPRINKIKITAVIIADLRLCWVSKTDILFTFYS